MRSDNDEYRWLVVCNLPAAEFFSFQPIYSRNEEGIFSFILSYDFITLLGVKTQIIKLIVLV